MGYSAKAVANYFLSRYRKHGITPLKIQKLVYLAHGWYMAFHEDPLIDDEYAEAWRYGPVFSSLYHEFKHRGRLPIVDFATELEFDDFMETDPKITETTPKVDPSDTQTINLLDKIWSVYGNRSGMELSRITHKTGSPWEETRNETGWRKNAHIDDKRIKAYYKKLGAENRRRKQQEKGTA